MPFQPLERKNLNVQVDTDLYEKFSDKCASKRLSKSEVIRALIEAYINSQINVITERKVSL